LAGIVYTRLDIAREDSFAQGAVFQSIGNGMELFGTGRQSFREM
jgi:hypothetical protein